MKVIVKQGQVEREPAEVLVLSHFEGEAELDAPLAAMDRLLDGRLRALLRSGEFEGKLNQTVLIHTSDKLPAQRVLLVGLGKRKEVRLDCLRQAMGTAIKRVRQTGASSCVTCLPEGSWPDSSRLELAQALVEGALLGAYRFTAYLSDHQAHTTEIAHLTLLATDTQSLDALREGVRRGVIAAEATILVRDLCNHPANVMTPRRLAAEARKLAHEHGVRVTVLGRAQCERLGMGAFLGVARGSHEPPQFIVLDYRGQAASRHARGAGGRNRRPLVIVGKTITFDSGGISLKPAENMEQMKADMTGGAAVLATVQAAARLRLPIHVIGILPATENMPGGRAIKPGDIVRTLSGKTVEVQNTDAEGRLALADALTYAARLKPAAVVDIATLTGACMVALGQFAIGMFGNDEALKGAIRDAGVKTGERVWEMPLWEEYFEQLKSDVADMRNIGGRGGGMITAALFLSKFIGDHPWVHLDIASTDWSERERAYIPKGPTGIGTRLLIQYLIDHSLAAS
jgi:leucyl aminopeptidase